MGGYSGGGFNAPVSYMPSYGGAPGGFGQPQAIPVMAGAVPMVAGVARWAMKFPSLWQALQKFRAQRIQMTPDKLYMALRRFGPATLSAMIGAAAVSDLITYKATHKSRRMNVANTKALRRGLRRLKGFDRLSVRVSQQLSRSCKPRRSKKC